MKKIFMRFFDDKIVNYIDMFFATLFICLLCIVSFSQICLVIPKTRQAFTNVDISDGPILAGSEAIMEKGVVTLKLHQKPDNGVKILVNGEEYKFFESEIETVEIYNQSVIEIKNESSKNVIVSLESVSDNLDAVLNNESINVNKIDVICRVIFKE